MAKHNETGVKGEQIATRYLLNIGYKILSQNWRLGRKEVDCIARDGDLLVFIEIKTRHSFDFGFPEESVNHTKKNHIKQAAAAYSTRLRHQSGLRFDIISILLDASGEPKEILHIKDAFY